ncbi:MAG: hypothetical protein BSOLF_0415 [Candidatus Carbobacillus altaicus]|uniref:Signal recognition particle receptor FtsY n=1 Tax=Candidatus Carbonibacillus altaicus TaxID=2163959 RepID=A0A2R6Y5F6_9BACL|nr:MAG: hypothetical protein BSOLF_0415 [Candidatus Carbobacillus altaicus]
MGLFDRLTASLKKAGENVAKSFQEGMRKTREAALSPFSGLFGQNRAIDEAFYEELEEALIMADVGVDTVMRLMDTLREDVRKEKIKDASRVPGLLKRRLIELLEEVAPERELKVASAGPTVYLFVGVNGVGKTTTIGKLARQLKESGSSVILAAGDTFRAGAIEQLKIWGERAGCEVVAKESGSDPAAVVFDAIRLAKEHSIDFVLCDTAGRLQNKANLMEELAKIRRVIQREIPDAPHEVLLVLDATTGQNALRQAETFKEVVDVSGLILTKLDGTAKGGIALAIHEQYRLPVKLVGLGEGLYDLQPFAAEAYVNALFPEEMKQDEGDERGERVTEKASPELYDPAVWLADGSTDRSANESADRSANGSAESVRELNKDTEDEPPQRVDKQANKPIDKHENEPKNKQEVEQKGNHKHSQADKPEINQVGTYEERKADNAEDDPENIEDNLEKSVEDKQVDKEKPEKKKWFRWFGRNRSSHDPDGER